MNGTGASSSRCHLWLASKSPRRQQLLREAGFDFNVIPADLDDGDLRHGDVPPEWWVMSLAFFKARRVADQIREPFDGLVLGADTVCAIGRSVLGQPRDEGDARRMLTIMSGREHRTLTGVCLLPMDAMRARLVVFDAAVVQVGALSPNMIESYLASQQWQGKAGAYNLAERQDAGWPIECRGDPTTVMGLPMRRLPGWIDHARRLAGDRR